MELLKRNGYLRSRSGAHTGAAATAQGDPDDGQGLALVERDPRTGKLVLSPKYGTGALPETFVIDKRGRIVAVSRGTVTREFLDNALKKALHA